MVLLEKAAEIFQSGAFVGFFLEEGFERVLGDIFEKDNERR